MLHPARFLLPAAFLLGTPFASAAEPLAFPNAGFEEGLASWYPDKNDQANGLSLATAEAARTGASGLRVNQNDTHAGSWLQSARIPVESAKTYRLEFWSRVVETSGIGVWIQFYDENHQTLKSPGGDPTVQLKPDATDWERQELQFTPPQGSAFFTLAVHGYNKRVVKTDFDDFSLTPVEGAPAAAAKASSSSALTPDPARVQQIAAALPAQPKGIGPSYDNRTAWNALAAIPEMGEKVIPRAGRFLAEPIPEVTAESYAASLATKDRKVDRLADSRRFRLTNFVLAEGMENKGRFLAAINAEILAICSEPSWIFTSHVPFSNNRNDLGTAMTAWSLATADGMLGDRLPADTRRIIRERVRERLWVHYLATLRGETKPEWWAIDPNNWNSVVHGGIVGSALALNDSVEERALIIAGAERGTQLYIKGFPSDGYSPEGMGYWKYGFGHYVLLAEAVRSATNGKVNFYDRDNIRLIAQFPRRFEMSSALYPAYGDSQFLEAPAAWLYHIIDRRYGFGDGSPRVIVPDATYTTFIYAYGSLLTFDSSTAPAVPAGPSLERGYRPRDWFEQSQIYVGRPSAGASADALAVSVKAGVNNVSHGHNDLGTFTVARNGVPVIADPGVTVYNAFTMGPNAFDHQIKASYGHSVPLVAGQWQKRGAKHLAVLREHKFADTLDTLLFDLKRGYDVASVRELTRRFDYSRVGKGGFMITDRVVFETPQAFGTALVTYGEAREEKPGVWIVTYNGQSLRAEIATVGNVPFTVTDELLKDEARLGKVRRLGINLNAPATEATIAIKITATN